MEQAVTLNKPKKLTTRKLAMIAMLGALSAVLMLFNFPIPFMPTFLKFDLAELPALLGGFMMGPLSGTLIILVKLALKLLMQGSETLLAGEFANLIGSLTFVLPAIWIYERNRTKKGAAIGLVVSTILSSVVSIFGNAFIAVPLYASVYGMPLEAIIQMGTVTNPHVTDMITLMLFGVFPFNIIKNGAVAVLTFILYKRTSTLLRKFTEKQ